MSYTLTHAGNKDMTQVHCVPIMEVHASSLARCVGVWVCGFVCGCGCVHVRVHVRVGVCVCTCVCDLDVMWMKSTVYDI